jgi:hypothetical protein
MRGFERKQTQMAKALAKPLIQGPAQQSLLFYPPLFYLSPALR